MQIAIDIRPLQLDAYKNRGIGTHLRNWIEAAQHLSTTDTFSLLFDPNLSRPEIKLTSSRWQLSPLHLPYRLPTHPATTLHINPDEAFAFDSALEAFLVEQGYDLFHATYTLMWETYAPRRLYHTRWLTTFYDLIPLLFRQQYLEPYGQQAQQSFAQRVGAAIYAQRILTISRAIQKDLTETIQIDPAKIDVIYGGIADAFQPLPTEEIEPTIKQLGISGPYLFSVNGFSHTKNLRRLLQAYSLLPQKNRLQLVVLCPLAGEPLQIVRGWLAEFGIEKQTILLNPISQPELVALYNGADLLVHPSLYEGLGLPILEAMRCGTPVVTANISSMPEIAGQAAELVNPYEVQDIARGINRVLESQTLQTEMIEQGLKQSAKFSWKRTAQAVLNGYSRAAAEPLYSLKRVFSISSPKRLRIAYWSPLNPCPSGIADYSESLVSELGKQVDIELIVDGYQPANLPFFDSFPSFDVRAYPALARRQPYDINLYQVGNNPLHKYMYEPILNWPGIITLHESCIFHFILAALGHSGHAGERFWEEVAYCEGIDRARQARLDYKQGTLDDYSLFLNKRLIEASRGVVIHNEYTKKKIEHYPDRPPLALIPLGIFTLDDDGGRFGALVRRLVGLPEDSFIFGSFGNIHRVKRIPVILRALARLREKQPHVYLLLMGRITDPSLHPLIQPLQENPYQAQQQGIFIHPYYATYEFMLMMMQAVNAGINLRYPTAGESSASLSLLLGQGKPTVVSAVGSFTEYPDSCCPKTPINDNEEETLYQHMLTLVQDKPHYQQASNAARRFSHQRSWPICAQKYLDFIETILKQDNQKGGGL